MKLLHKTLHGFACEEDLDNVAGRHDGRALLQGDLRDADLSGTTFDDDSGQLTRDANAHLHDH
ncbi:hypothetical protein [Arthrobacter sp. NicSoilB8]|uniref:hypothetical protein n=1 Tax=Arthrobacter sp. NicSoilB8 TaxID=2830998 RepID=UPI001CC47BFB|nr:hypothetical protein [Arthrobacter sp. NicSoilB8]